MNEEKMCSIIRLSGWLLNARLAHDPSGIVDYLHRIQTAVDDLLAYYEGLMSPDEVAYIVENQNAN